MWCRSWIQNLEILKFYEIKWLLAALCSRLIWKSGFVKRTYFKLRLLQLSTFWYQSGKCSAQIGLKREVFKHLTKRALLIGLQSTIWQKFQLLANRNGEFCHTKQECLTCRDPKGLLIIVTTQHLKSSQLGCSSKPVQYPKRKLDYMFQLI